MLLFLNGSIRNDVHCGILFFLIAQNISSLLLLNATFGKMHLSDCYEKCACIPYPDWIIFSELLLQNLLY